MQFRLLLAAIALALVSAACSSGTKRSVDATPTPGPVPSVEEITALVGQGFVGEEIDFSQTLVSAFRDPQAVIDQVKACGAPAGPAARTDPSYWPVQLGTCYFAANATMRLYQFTGRSEFLDANRLLERLHQSRVEEAQADGANLGEQYWKLVAASVYDVNTNPAATPSAAGAHSTRTP
jgi:hypothetical protein